MACCREEAHSVRHLACHSLDRSLSRSGAGPQYASKRSSTQWSHFYVVAVTTSRRAQPHCWLARFAICRLACYQRVAQPSCCQTSSSASPASASTPGTGRHPDDAGWRARSDSGTVSAHGPISRRSSGPSEAPCTCRCEGYQVAEPSPLRLLPGPQRFPPR